MSKPKSKAKVVERLHAERRRLEAKISPSNGLALFS